MGVQGTDLMMVERAGSAYRTTAAAVAALGGAGGAWGTATVTLPYGCGVMEHEETAAAAGAQATDTITAFLAAGTDADENQGDGVDLVSLVAVAGVDVITFRLAFSSPQSGPIKLIWKVMQ